MGTINSKTIAWSILLLSPGIAHAQIKEAAVLPDNDGRTVITWSYGKAESPVDIYWGTSPENVDKNGTLLAKGVRGTSYIFYAPETTVQAIHKAVTGKRVYYAIKPQNGKSVITATRKLNYFNNIEKLDNFKPVNNFRETGGYLNKEGKRVKWGKFYRSNELSTLNKKEIEFVKTLGIGTVFDLRGDKEVKEFPDANIGAEMVYFKEPTAETPSDPNARNPQERLKMWGKMAKGNQGTYDHMVNSNKKYATDYIPLYQKMFRILVNEKPGTPILGHCAGGKDRTGAYMAVVLSALDVPRETIMNDYLLTGIYRQLEDDIELNYVKKLNDLTDEEIEIVAPAWRVYPEYLQAFLNTVDEKYGSMDNYLEKECGLTPAMKAKLKQLYLEE